MIKQFSALAALVLFVAGALAAPIAYAEDGESKKGGAKKKDPKTRVVCIRTTQVGSHFRRRVCHTQSQWDEMQRAAQEWELSSPQEGGPGEGNST